MSRSADYPYFLHWSPSQKQIDKLTDAYRDNITIYDETYEGVRVAINSDCFPPDVWVSLEYSYPVTMMMKVVGQKSVVKVEVRI